MFIMKRGATGFVSNVIRSFSTHHVNRGVSGNVLKSLAAVVGDKNVSNSETVREQHGKDESCHKACPPDLVVWPNSTEQVSEVAKICSAHHLPMIPFGAGTGLEGGTVALSGGVSIDMKNMSDIHSFHPDDFDATVQAGVSRLTLNEHIKDCGLWFPVDPGADATLCGMAATSASGTNAVRYGTMRENVMNLEVVLANGTIINTAGRDRRTRKTSAGYNLTNLFVGSEGTLGIITKATVRLYPLPESMTSAVCTFPTAKAAIDTTVMVMQCGISIARIEYLNDTAISCANRYSNMELKAVPTLFFEFHGSSVGIEQQMEQVADIVAANDGSDYEFAVEMEKRNKLWKARHNLYYATRAWMPNHNTYMTDVCVPISHLAEVILSAEDDILKNDVKSTTVGHVGDGNFHCSMLMTPDDEDQNRTVVEIADRMARHALSLNGTCTGEHGIGIGKKNLLTVEFSEDEISVMKSLKSTLDPVGLMNPGKIFI